MRKRLRKKISKRKCLKCGSTSGMATIYQLKSGRWVSSGLICDFCDIGIERGR